MTTLLRVLRMSGACVAVALLTACAFGTRNATLLYPPKGDAGVVPAAQAAVATPAPAKRAVTLVTFVDQRTDKNAVGTMRNGFGMRTADVLASNSVTNWVTQAVKLELEKRGYAVTLGAPQAAGAVVTGEVLKVFCDMYMSYTGQVSLRMQLSRDGQGLITRNYDGEGSAGIAFAGTAESFAESLSRALAAALKPLIADLDGQLSAP